MSAVTVDVTGSGAVLLGDQITCDGFHRGYSTRVQTHVHDDHMSGFDISKGEQYIYCTRPTRALLIADQNADLPYRTNLVEVSYNEWRQVGDTRFMLVENGHMLGSAQVVAELPSGQRAGYSGDFAGGVAAPIQVDTLVVDATCGRPGIVRTHSQERAEEALIETVRKSVAHEPVYIRAARGTLHRAMMALTGNIDYPLLGSERLMSEVDVYRTFGQPISEIVYFESDVGRELSRGNRYIRVFGARDRLPVDTSEVTVVNLNAYVPNDEPVVQHSDHSYTVALTNHADFEETLEYVSSTGASRVITDCTRSQHAPALAKAIRSRLGIEAEPSTSERSFEWGG